MKWILNSMLKFFYRKEEIAEYKRNGCSPEISIDSPVVKKPRPSESFTSSNHQSSHATNSSSKPRRRRSCIITFTKSVVLHPTTLYHRKCKLATEHNLNPWNSFFYESFWAYRFSYRYNVLYIHIQRAIVIAFILIMIRFDLLTLPLKRLTSTSSWCYRCTHFH